MLLWSSLRPVCLIHDTDRKEESRLVTNTSQSTSVSTLTVKPISSFPPRPGPWLSWASLPSRGLSGRLRREEVSNCAALWRQRARQQRSDLQRGRDQSCLWRCPHPDSTQKGKLEIIRMGLGKEGDRERNGEEDKELESLKSGAVR